jgi:hypothetical protein
MTFKLISGKWVALIDVGYGLVNVLQVNTLKATGYYKHIGRNRRIYHDTKAQAELFAELYHFNWRTI